MSAAAAPRARLELASSARIRFIAARHQGRMFRGGRLHQANGPFLDRVLQQAPETPDAVLPSDLLALFIGSAPVSDADFVDPQPPFGNLDRDLRLKTKAVLFEGNGLNDLPAEDLVAGFHVSQVDVGKAV
jgi:hypothetical protein